MKKVTINLNYLFLLLLILLALSFLDVFFWLKIFLLFIPGVAILSLLPNNFKLKWYEFIPLAVTLSMGVITLSGVYISFTSFHIIKTFMYLIMALIVYLCWLVSLKLKKSNIEIYYSSPWWVMALLPILIFIIGIMIPLEEVLKYKYFIGWDTWLTSIISRDILVEKLIPLNLNVYSLTNYGRQGLGLSGYFFFLSSLQTIVGMTNNAAIIKFAGPIFLGIVSLLLFCIGTRIIDRKFGFFFALLYSTSTFVIIRFTMGLRENFSIIFFLSFLLLALIFHERVDQYKNGHWISALPLSVLVAVTLISEQSAGTVLLGFILIFTLLKDWIQKENIKSLHLILSALLGILFVVYPYRMTIYQIYTWQIFNWFKPLTLLIIITPGAVLMLLIFLIGLQGNEEDFFKRHIKIRNFKNLILYLALVGLCIGALLAVIYPSEASIPEYHPKIVIEDFSIAQLLFFPLGIVHVLKRKDVYKRLISFLLPLIFIISFILSLNHFGSKLAQYRMIIFISLIMSGISAVLLREVIKKQTMVRGATAIICLLVFSSSILNGIEAKATPSFDEINVAEARIFKNDISKESYIVIPQERTKLLLAFVEVNNLITNSGELSRIYAMDSEQFRSYICNKYQGRNVYVFISWPWARGKMKYVNTEILDKFGILLAFEKNKIYKISMPCTTLY